jgi:hypothetical protein
MKVLRDLFLAAGAKAMVGCGAATATPGASSSTPNPVDVAGAQRAALGLFVENPSYAGNWLPCGWNESTCPLSATVKARLVYLGSTDFGSDVNGCGEDYITGTQNGMFNAPKVLSASAENNANVTVVISWWGNMHRGESDSQRSFRRCSQPSAAAAAIRFDPPRSQRRSDVIR